MSGIPKELLEVMPATIPVAPRPALEGLGSLSVVDPEVRDVFVAAFVPSEALTPKETK